MFRRKDSDAGRPATPASGRSDTSAARSPADGPGKAPLQPELPRRKVDIPTAPSVPAAQHATTDRPAAPPAATADSDRQGKRLIVGQGIRLNGEITACDLLVVEGHVEVTLNETRAVEIAPTGRFIGGCEVEAAEISGVYEGELTVSNRLLIRSTGRVDGTVRYGEIEIERGGRLSGSVSMIDSGNSAKTGGNSGGDDDAA